MKRLLPLVLLTACASPGKPVSPAAAPEPVAQRCEKLLQWCLAAAKAEDAAERKDVEALAKKYAKKPEARFFRYRGEGVALLQQCQASLNGCVQNEVSPAWLKANSESCGRAKKLYAVQCP